jgi:aryl-phospho-beta-D-glucosidase BglC (GH1 family)
MPHYGFNLLWMFSADSGPAQPPDERALDFLAAEGFSFVRVPTDYRYWVRNFDYLHPDESAFALIDRYLEACRSRGLHMSLNLHRGPGYCINRNEIERHNLWLDQAAQDGFVFQWATFARRYRGVPAAALSFDLLNEPPEVGQYGMTRAAHAAIMRRTAAAIHAIDPDRPIVIDGLGGGHLAMPELADLGATHSGRGYQPMPVSHHQAAWWPGHVDAPPPVYPGQVWEGRGWNRETLRDFYRPWREVEARGVPIHIGEFGCYERTPNDIALRWFADLLAIYREFGWGYALWNFEGPFGIVGHGRPGARFEQRRGYLVDRDLLELLLAGRVA